MTFGDDIKDRVLDLCFELEKVVKKVKDEREKYTTSYACVEEDPELVKLLEPIIEAHKNVVRRNILFVDPPQFHDGGVVRASLIRPSELDGLSDIVDDFINFAARCFMQLKLKSEKRKYFQERWAQFESDFFADEVDITLKGFIYCFWLKDGVLEDTIPESDLNMEWQGRLTDSLVTLHILRDAQYSVRGNLDPYPNPYEDTPPHYILKNTIRVKKSARLEHAFQQARANFDRVTFLIRTVCGGGAHYSAITASMVGNYMNNGDLTVYEPLNQQFCPLETSQFSYSNDVQFKRLWPELKPRDMRDFRFQNQKYRDFAQVSVAKKNYRYGKDYDLTLKLEKILDLVQIVESTIGDFGRHNAEYISTMLNRASSLGMLRNMIELRHKYAHGKPDEINEIFTREYQDNLDLLEKDIKSFFFLSRLVISKAIANPNLKDDLLNYHLGLGKSAYVNGVLQRGTAISGITFPALR